MDKKLQQLFEIYKTILIAHITTKTTDSQFHEKSEGWYNLMFDVFHTIAEKRQDLQIDSPVSETVYNDVYDSIEKAKTIIEGMIKEKNSVGMDNLLRGLADRLEFACGDSLAFVTEENEKE